MKIIISSILLIILLVFSCKNGQKEITLSASKWQGRQIIFPDKPIFTLYGTDTVDYQIPQSEYKIVVYVDSTGCIDCKLQLHKWKSFIEYVDSVTRKRVPFMFFFHPKDRTEIRYLLKGYEIDFPVCVDMDNVFNRLNRFPVDAIYQALLLDRDNKVLINGDPIGDIETMEMYIKELAGGETPMKKALKTTAEITQSKIDFGEFDKSEMKEEIIEVRNIGSNPLVLVDVSTTCGCVVTTYDKYPARPGESLQVKVRMIAKDTGFFDKNMTITYNAINNQPVRVKIIGYVR